MKPVRDIAHLKFVRTLPCLVRFCRSRRSDASHCGPHGMSQKASDHSTVPLCRKHHQELHQLGRLAFEAKHSLDLLATAEKLAQKPLVKLQGSAWVGILHGETHVLAPRNAGIAEAIRKMGVVRREVLQDWFERKLAS